jgi:uracil-DNA glycosylase family 4
MNLSDSEQATSYDSACRRCPRLATFLDQVKSEHPDYFCRPVAPFGDPAARFLVVGLAPGLHGANASGRPFTGDWCGPLLYAVLHRYGFASEPPQQLRRDDGLQLYDCRISNAVKCLPPQNKPELAEMRCCNRFLAHELALSKPLRVLLALGTIAHQAVIEALGLKIRDYKFGHHARHVLPDGRILFDSYHVSRYNTNTGRLTEAMFAAVVADVRATLSLPDARV